MTLQEARQWCKNYAASKYENFEVVSLFLPKMRRDEYLALYAFARGADDRADEIAAGLPSEDVRRIRIDALAQWRNYLNQVYEGKVPPHPAFIALRPVIEKHNIEKELFDHLIRAFEQDQDIRRYQTWDDILGYTSGSANPVGRWILRLYGHHNQELDCLSDDICTGLQLVNFLQDVRSDYVERDRIYLPQEDMELFDVVEEDLSATPTPSRLRKLLAYEAERAEHLLNSGKPLIGLVAPGLRGQLSLFHGGGRLALHTLSRAQYDISVGRHHVGKLQRVALIQRVLRGRTL